MCTLSTALSKSTVMLWRFSSAARIIGRSAVTFESFVESISALRECSESLLMCPNGARTKLGNTKKGINVGTPEEREEKKKTPPRISTCYNCSLVVNLWHPFSFPACFEHSKQSQMIKGIEENIHFCEAVLW